MAKTKSPEDGTTEEKIKEAARSVFTQKGFAAARTRDIAEEAGINLALLNYYFRSKEKLFDIIMQESLQHFMQGIKAIINNELTSFDEKISMLVDYYTDMLTIHPNLPLFIMGEIRSNPDRLFNKMGIKNFILNSHFIKQYQQETMAKKQNALPPLQLIMTILGLVIFPFIASPLLQKLGDIDQKEFNVMMQERKKKIPDWIRAIISSN